MTRMNWKFASGLVLAAFVITSPARAVNWTAPGYYIEVIHSDEFKSLFTDNAHMFTGGPFATEAECKAAWAKYTPVQQGNNSCVQWMTKPPSVSLKQMIQGGP